MLHPLLVLNLFTCYSLKTQRVVCVCVGVCENFLQTESGLIFKRNDLSEVQHWQNLTAFSGNVLFCVDKQWKFRVLFSHKNI